MYEVVEDVALMLERPFVGGEGLLVSVTYMVYFCENALENVSI